MTRPTVVAALAAALAYAPGIRAQCPGVGGPEGERPRVGLVLGGGGARGIAHVGVLKVLEELRVPVDYVAGTSMGAIVGGLYAAGVSPAAMEAWLRRADFDDLFRDQPSYSRLSFRRKQEARDYPIPLEVGVGPSGIQLPNGLVAGQKLNAVLRSMTFPVARVDDFDSLAVPFRAVATDLETGQMVVLRDGDLVDAIRASMSVPGVFTPYPVADRLLVDGGLVRNLPVDVACDMGADLVIVVDVGSRLAVRSELASVVDLTMQVTRIMTRSGAATQIAGLGPGDILIEPDLGDLGASSFDRSLEALAAGEAAARAAASRLRRLAVDPATYEAVRTRRIGFGEPPQRAEFVMVGAYSGRSPGSLLERIVTRPGPMDTLTLAEDIEHLYSLGIYERVDYRMVETDEGTAVILRVREKPWGPAYLRFRLAISDRLGGDGTYNLASHVLVPQMNDWGAELVGELQVGEGRRAYLELYQPLGVRGIVFVTPWAEHQSTPSNAYVGDLTVARYRVDATTGGLTTGLHIGTDMEIAVSLERGVIGAERAIGPDTLGGFDAEVGIARFHAIVDGLDDPLFPTSGMALGLEARSSREWLGASDAYTRLDGQLFGAVTRHGTTLFAFAGGTTGLDTPLPGYARAGLGGFLQLSGYRVGEISGSHMLFGRAMLYRELGSDRAYAGLSLEAGNAWETRAAVDLADLRYSAALVLGLRTPLGPVYLGWGTRGAGAGYGYLEVGRSL